MNAIGALNLELKKVQKAQAKLVDDNGVVKPYSQYYYQQLARQCAEIKKGIILLEEIKQDNIDKEQRRRKC